MVLDIAMDPEPHLHRDFRSPSIPKQRHRKTLTKYYSYRAVHPSWVGQSYYTLQLVSSEVHTARTVPHRLRHKTPDPYITHVTEKEEPALLETLREDHGWHNFHPLWITCETHVAIAQAKAADVNVYPIVLPESYPTESDIPTNPRDIERIPIQPPHDFPPTLPTNLHLKLRIKTWTKEDNYNNSIYFWWGPDRRHSRGKRRVRERHLQKWNEKDLGRGTRQRTSRLGWEVNGSRGIIRDRWQGSANIVYDDWMSEYDMFGGRDADFSVGRDWCDDAGCAVEDDEWRGGCGSFAEDVGCLEVVREGPEWPSLWCGYEGMPEFEDADEDDAFSVGSDVVVLDHFDFEVDVDLDADFDRMSDIAEVLVEGEWDVVSDTSSLFGT